MHLRRSKLVERTTRLTERIGHGSVLVRQAAALERLGVIATYQIHDRAFGNGRARRRFAHSRPVLDDVQTRVLAELERQDYAVLPFAELVLDRALRDRVGEEAAAFTADAERLLATGDASVRDTYKDYLVRRYRRRDEVIPLDAAWLACVLSDRMLGLANAYLRMSAKLEYVDFWYSVPVPPDSERIQSQRWHRDFDDRHMLKAFLYLVDVDESTGPFEFVADSARGSTLANYYPWSPLGEMRPTQAEFERTVPVEQIRTLTAPKGTLVLCNTSGFHRGGFATGRPRVLATATYCSPASLASLTERNYRLPPGAEQSHLPAQRYAVS